MEFTGHPTRIRGEHFGMDAVQLVLKNWATAGMAEPTEPLRDDLVYLPYFGDIACCQVQSRIGRGSTTPEAEHRVFTSDGENLLLGYKPEDVSSVVIHRDGEWISLNWETGYAPGNRSWQVNYEGPDEGAKHEHTLLKLILPHISLRFKYIAVTSYSARDADLLREAGFSLPDKQSSCRSVIWWRS